MTKKEEENIKEILNTDFEEIQPWNGEHDSGYDVRQKWSRNFKRIANNFMILLNSLDENVVEFDKRFLRKDKEDSTEFLLRLLAGAFFGDYKKGVSGGYIDGEGNAEFANLVTRLKAILAELQVNGPAMFKGNLSSEEFISGFLGGKGWAIVKKEVLNALGIPEIKYTAEFDEVIVRGTLRVFEMIISQLLGENDNRVFTGMMEVHHYDAESGKIYLDTIDGKLYNPFRKDDYIMVQQFNGMPTADNDYYVTKHYEMVITDAGCGNLDEKENRLDWVKFKSFTAMGDMSPADIIRKGDTLVRVDSATNPDRKGIMQIITVGANAPYMDVLYGLKTDPDNALKSRMGNLRGIRHHLFGWLQGFGLYINNLYAVGDFRLRRTGESLDAKVEVLEGSMASTFQKLVYQVTEEDCYLTNASFSESLEYWSKVNESKIFTVNGDAKLVNGNILLSSGTFAAVEPFEGRNMLHIVKGAITQDNQYIRKPGKHKEYIKPAEGETAEPSAAYKEVRDDLYLSVRFLARTSGTLEIGFPSAAHEPEAIGLQTIMVTSSMEWQTFQYKGTWDGLGDFILSYTGDMYVSVLALTDKALDEFRLEMGTKIEQDAANVRILAWKSEKNKTDIAALVIRADEISSTVLEVQTAVGVNKELAAKEAQAALDKAVEAYNAAANAQNSADANAENILLQATTIQQTAESVTALATRVTENGTAITVLQQTADGLNTAVTNVKGDLEAASKAAAAATAAAQTTADNAATAAANAWTRAGTAIDNASTANSNALAAWNKAVVNATAISQNADAIALIAGRFDSDGNLILSSGVVITDSFAAIESKYDSLNGELATKASISTSVQYDPDTKMITSAVKLSGDKISLNGYTDINGGFSVDTSGITHIGAFTVGPGGLYSTEAADSGAYISLYHTASNGHTLGYFELSNPVSSNSYYLDIYREGGTAVKITAGTGGTGMELWGTTALVTHGTVDIWGNVKVYGETAATCTYRVKALYNPGEKYLKLQFKNGLLQSAAFE